jgi:hypothetical protein
MQQNINTWQTLNDEDFIQIARYIRDDMVTDLDKNYIESRLKVLGYEMDYGCCGRNRLKMIPRA